MLVPAYVETCDFYLNYETKEKKVYNHSFIGELLYERFSSSSIKTIYAIDVKLFLSRGVEELFGRRNNNNDVFESMKSVNIFFWY